MDHGELRQAAIIGCLLGTAHGDALGLPYEGLSPRRASRLLGEPCRYRLLFDRGMVSDDTEHAVMVALSLISTKLEPSLLSRALAWHLRLWFLALPAGMGLATLRAGLKLLVGFPPSKSGVYSAGNGPAMRAPLLGVVARDKDHLLSLAQASTTLTHTDPKAYHGAVAIAVASWMAACAEEVAPEAYLSRLRECLPPEASEFLELVARAVANVQSGQSTRAFAEDLGLHRGVSGYVYHTVPVCVHAWLCNQGNVCEAVRSVIRCGGDADTTAAIVGGISGAQSGPDAIPAEQLDKLLDWPWNASRLARLGCALSKADDAHHVPNPPRPLWLCRLPRNLLFLTIVLLHGVRRLFPPY